MQPLPSPVTRSVFVESAAAFRSAAAASEADAIVAGLRTGASKMQQGIPSLRMTSGPDARPLVTALEDAADGARALAGVISDLDTPTVGPLPTDTQDLILGWANLADGASASVPPFRDY